MNVFDQYEQESQKSKATSLPNVEMTTSGYLEINIEPNVPIFTKSKKDFTPSDRITHVAISNKFLVVAMANSLMFRMNLANQSENEEIALPRGNRLSNLFLDPYGFHTILLCGNETYYLSRKMNAKLRPLTPRMGNHEVTQVAWCDSNDADNKTGPILLGTSKGLIWETDIMLDGEKYWKQVFDIGKGSNVQITGLQYYNLPETEKYIVFASTPARLYLFTGNASTKNRTTIFQQVFSKYLSIPEMDTCIEQADYKYSQIHFWSENLCTPNGMAWLTAKGVLFAQLDFDFLHNINLKDLEDRFSKVELPICEEEDFTQAFTMALTEFHVLVAYHNCIRGLSVLNSEQVYEDNYNEAFGRLVNVIRDYITGTVWAVTEKNLFRYRIKNEDRNLWQIYCQRKEFDLAKRFAKNNKVFYNEVLIQEAAMHFEKGEYKLSALRYAETRSSFEEICLKFMQLEQLDALKLFLRKKLDNFDVQDKTQITMIALWLIELYLSQMEELRLQGKDASNEYYELQKDFQSFMDSSRVAACIKKNKSSVYDLMISHGDKLNAIKLTEFNKDYKSLIRQHIYKNSFVEALEVLKSQNNRELFYQFAPILIQEIPKLVVKTLIDQKGNLQASKLLPALVSCNGETQSKEVIKYLEFCINNLKCPEKAVHNLLISLYAKYEPQKLLQYLDSQGQNAMCINYDIHFALRLCQEYNLTVASVQLSCLLGLWESAVDMGLTIGQDIAIGVANQAPENDVELRKKLWLKIARHVISGKDDIQTAMEFLKICDEYIRIEDILTFFSDFVTIDHFKDAICNSLKKYNHDIEELKKEMDEATVFAEAVRKQIQSFRNKYTRFKPTDLCEICQVNILIRPFYMFPCRHRFHADCLTKELKPLLGPAKRNKLADLQLQLNMVNKQTVVDNISTGSSGLTSRDMVRNDIDSILASECLYCGENMIRNINEPFYSDAEYEQILKDWE